MPRSLMDMAHTEERAPEVELLLCCARTRIDNETTERIQELAHSSLDWSALVQLGEEHMVLPLLYRNLREAAPDAVPPVVQKQLRNGFHTTVRNNLLFTHELLDLLELFDEQGIPVVPFKGPVAAASVYDDLHLRPFGDLDLLVHLEDVPQAQSLLLDGPFEDWEDLPALTTLDYDRPPSWYSALAYPFGKAKTFYRASGDEVQVSVELHWELMPPYLRHPLDPERFWERLQTVTVLDEPVRTFSSENTLLYFCLHGTVHRWNALRLVCDVAEFLRRHQTIDWEGLVHRATRLNSKRVFFLGLRLAHELLAAPLPATIRRRVYSDDAVRSLTDRCLRKLFEKATGTSRIWNTWAYDLQSRDRVGDGIGLCFAATLAAFPTPLRKLFRTTRE